MEWDYFLEVLIRGAAIGMVYALMGLGLTLIFGVMRIINFAQGEFYMLGGYVAVYVILATGNIVLGIILAMVIIFVLGAGVEKTLLSQIRTTSGRMANPVEYSLIITFALSIFFQKAAIMLFGSAYRKPPDYLAGNVTVFKDIQIPGNMVIGVLVAIAVISMVSLFLSKTWTGRSWRAISQSVNGAAVTGVNIKRESTVVFGFSTAIAAIAGAVLAPITLIFPAVGSPSLIRGYQIIAIGGLGSIPGSIIGGLILGLAETLGAVYINSAYRTAYGFGILILFLLFRPRGLFGQS